MPFDDDITVRELRSSNERYIMPSSFEEAIAILDKIDEAGLDFETTGRRPEEGAEVRLTSICNADHHILIDHFYIGKFEKYIPYMRKQKWWVYNAKFEQKFFDHYDPDFETVTVLDVDFLKKVKMGGGPSSLAGMCRDIGIKLEKSEQASDWSSPTLSERQLNYAAFDSHVTWKLRKHWYEETTPEQRGAFHILNDAVRGTIECEDTGLYLDFGVHKETVDMWHTKRTTCYKYLRRFTPKEVVNNLQSDQQIGEFFKKELPADIIEGWPKTAKTKKLQITNDLLRSLGLRVQDQNFSRWIAALVGYRYYGKYISTYGDVLLEDQVQQGKIKSRFNIGQARTVRYSSSARNLQNIPRKVVVRRAFHAPKSLNQLMLLADYKGIEIRVLGEISQDEQLLYDCTYGDVHSASACAIFGHDYEYFCEVIESGGKGKYANIYPLFKEQRSKAKGFTFQLLYGAGAGALSDVLRCTYEEAEEAIRAWAKKYPKAYAYRFAMESIMMETGFLPVVDGRTIYIRRGDRALPVAANYPVQGAAASVMYRAVYWVNKLFKERSVNAWLAATVHDEVLAYCDKGHETDGLECLIDGMKDAWLDVFPGSNVDNLLDPVIGTTWADKP